jgi:hypothetical protein
LKEIERLEQE